MGSKLGFTSFIPQTLKKAAFSIFRRPLNESHASKWGHGAGDAIRTRDIFLGKEVLYP